MQYMMAMAILRCWQKPEHDRSCSPGFLGKNREGYCCYQEDCELLRELIEGSDKGAIIGKKIPTFPEKTGRSLNIISRVFHHRN